MPKKLKIEINDNTDEAQIFVGVRLSYPMYLPDNLVSACSRCHTWVQHRPDVAKHLKIICWECASKDPAFEQAAFRVTSQHINELARYLVRKRMN
jgi:hypothetical protein